jgi:hypothetical protein
MKEWFTADDVRAARERIAGHVRMTPLEESIYLSDDDHKYFFKLESQQLGKSFKIRGALNTISQLSQFEMECGVGTVSTGNHGVAVAMAARALGIRDCAVVVPLGTPHAKTDRIRYFGARSMMLGSDYDEALTLGINYIDRAGMFYVDPFEHDPRVYCGQGTIGLEIMEQRPDVDTIVVPVGGGGLITGIAVAAKSVKPDVICMVDNCYGEFVDVIEPSDVGADMTVGSLIKNPGGGLAPIGGYIVGTEACVARCAYRLSAPGLGQEVGANLGVMPALYQGFFLAPTVVAGALKGAIFAAAIYERLGYRVIPSAGEERNDIIQAVELGSREGMCAFCAGIQAAAPVDSYVTPEPWAMPGYESEVIMAAGAFVQGSSIELSADGPIREPYAVYFQGGLTWYHAKLGILMSLQKMVDAGLIDPARLD